MAPSPTSSIRSRAYGVVWAASDQDARRLCDTVDEEGIPLDLSTVNSLRELIALRAEQPVDLLIIWQSEVNRDANLQSYLHDWLGFRARASGLLVVPHPTPSEYLFAADLGFMDVIDQRNNVQLLFAIRRELMALATRRKLHHLLHEYEKRFIIDKKRVLAGTDIPSMEPLVMMLEQAIKHDGFDLEYQPILPLVDEGVDNYEVLIRLKRDEERISAKRFLPVAERYGLMSAIDRWVVRNALIRFDKACKAAGERKLRFFMNIASASLMDTAIIGHLLSTVTHYQAPPGSIVIEVPTNLVEQHLEHVKSLNASARGFKVGFALDGYTAPDIHRNYLQHLAVDYLKISAANLKGIHKDPRMQKQLQEILDFADAESLKVVANHVDSLDTLAYLVNSGVDFLEGFAVAEPAGDLSPGFFVDPVVL